MERPTDDAREVRERHAAAWAAALDAGPLNAASKAEMEGWLSLDDRNRGALIRAQVALTMLTRPLPTDAAEPRLNRRTLLGGVGASCVAAFTAHALWPSPLLDTAVGEIRQIPLADGSNVVLDTATALQPRFSTDRRDMRLERGRALFRVAHDPDRPFIVEADGIRVRAIGTMFSVDVSDAIEVLVAEGVVEVSGAGDPAILRAGQKGRFDRRTTGRVIATVPADDLARDLDWREGRLELEGQSLGEAAATMNRYTSRPIVITDAALAAAPLHGGFRTDDPEGFARAAALSLGARSHTEPNRIVISR